MTTTADAPVRTETALAAVPAQRGLRGRLGVPAALPGDDAYDALVAPWNRAVAVRPLAVVQPTSAEGVALAVRAAGDLGLRVTVQCTGHGAAADMAGQLLVQTGALDECTVHPEERWARVGAGVKWARVVQEAAPYGLAPLCGSTGDAGVVGYTTGGGTGPLARTYGLASDRVRAFEVVTGDGVLRRATPDTEPELFWGLRGGKGVLGIVTAVEFDLVEQPRFYGGAVYFDGADAPAVLDTWSRWSAGLPEEATTSVAVLRLPDLPGIPAPLAGRMSVAVRFAFTGDREHGEELFAPVRAVAPALLDGVAEMPYAAIDAVHADPVDPMPVAEGAALLDELPVDVLLEQVGPDSDSPLLLVEVRQLGGAVARPGEHDSAFCPRDAAFQLFAGGIALDPRVAPAIAALLAAVEPQSRAALLPNFAATADPAVFARCYTPEVLDRLRAAAQAYDPYGTLAVADLLG